MASCFATSASSRPVSPLMDTAVSMARLGPGPESRQNCRHGQRRNDHKTPSDPHPASSSRPWKLGYVESRGVMSQLPFASKCDMCAWSAQDSSGPRNGPICSAAWTHGPLSSGCLPPRQTSKRSWGEICSSRRGGSSHYWPDGCGAQATVSVDTSASSPRISMTTSWSSDRR